MPYWAERLTGHYGAAISERSPTHCVSWLAGMVGYRKHWHTDEFCALIDGYIQAAKSKVFDGYD